MEINILSINDENHVTVSSNYGLFDAVWADRNIPVKETRHVELDIPQKYIFSEIQRSLSNVSLIQQKADTTMITGLVESWENCVLFVRLGESLLMIETDDDESFVGLEKKFVSFEADKIFLYDIGL